MGLFKKFLKLRALPVGFATIHKKDDSDAQLKKPQSNNHVGFATIHKLKEDAVDDIFQKLSTGEHGLHHNEHLGGGEHHAAYQAKVAEWEKEKDAAGERYRARKSHEPYVMSPGAHMDRWLQERDKETFPHHHELNLVEKGHGKSAIEQYTRRSSFLNRWLIHKHKEPKLRAPRKHKDDFGHSVSDLHYYLKSQTNHKGNALHKDVMVHSGVGPEMAHLLTTVKVGDQVHFPAYTSTSTLHTLAHSFSSGMHTMIGSDDRSEHFTKHVVHFHLPKGYKKGRHVENITRNAGEHEMILHHGQTFKKVDHAEHHSYYYSPSFNKRKDTTIHHHFVPVD